MQSYGSTTLTQNVTLDAGTTIALGAVTGNAKNLSLDAASVTAGAVAGLTDLTTTAGTDVTATSVAATGVASLGDNVTTTGAQSYGSTTLTQNVTLDAGTTIALGAVTGNAKNLSLDAASVTAGAVAGLTDLTTTAGTDVTATSVAATGVASLGDNVTTTGAQSYGSTTLTQNVTLDAAPP